MNNLRKGCLVFNPKSTIITRHVQSNASLLENLNEVQNRNPRNLELMRIARKPIGYHLEKRGFEYYNKLYLRLTQRHIEAGVNHFKNGPIVKVSTMEWALKKQLYKSLNVASFANVGRVLAERCLESGITELYSDFDPTNSTRLTAFCDALKDGGIHLEETPIYKHANPWDVSRMIKPWTVQE